MSFFNDGSVKKNSRFEKIVQELDRLCASEEIGIKMNVDNKRLILRAVKPRLWETLIYPVPIMAFWIWFFVEKSKSDFGFVLLLGLTIYWIWTYFEISKGLNEIAIDHETNEAEITNLDRICRHFINQYDLKLMQKIEFLKGKNDSAV